MSRKPKQPPVDAHAFLQAAAERTAARTRYFALDGLLPTGTRLSLYLELGTLSLLGNCEDGPKLLAEQLFTPAEVTVLVPLLDSCPHFCPYELLLASFGGSTSDKAIEACRKRLHAAPQEAWDGIMRPVRNVMSRVRLKLNPMGLNTRSILETGYMLIAMKAEEHHDSM